MKPLQVVYPNGEARPTCDICRRKLGPVGRKRWTCIDCQIRLARRMGLEKEAEMLGWLKVVRERRSA